MGCPLAYLAPCSLVSIQQLVSFAPLFQRATTVQRFMWQPDLMRVAQSLEADVRMRQGIDPSGGSYL